MLKIVLNLFADTYLHHLYKNKIMEDDLPEDVFRTLLITFGSILDQATENLKISIMKDEKNNDRFYLCLLIEKDLLPICEILSDMKRSELSSFEFKRLIEFNAGSFEVLNFHISSKNKSTLQ